MYFCSKLGIACLCLKYNSDFIKNMDKLSNNEDESSRPLPCDFDVYLPWACQQLGVDAFVVVEKATQSKYLDLDVEIL